MLRAYKYRLYPNKEQIDLIEQHFAACRIIYNLAMEVRLYAYSSQRIFLNSYDLNKQLPELKKEFPWLNNIGSQVLQNEMKTLDSAFTNFYNKHTDFPKFRNKKKWKPSFKSPQSNKLINNKLYLNKFRDGIKILLERLPNGELRNVVISKSATGKYFASLTYETGIEIPMKKPINEKTAVGIDLGLTHFAILSDGTKIENHKFLGNNQTRLKILQKRISRQQKGSNRQKSQQHKINLLYEKITNQRKDFQHKLSTQIANDFDTVCMEDLNIKGMMKNHPLANAMGDVSWFQFKEMLRYKSGWYGKNFLEIGRFEPSSKLCQCGHKKQNLKLSDREWTCENCGTTHDRDILAANNIKKIALLNNERLSGQVLPVVDVELPTLVGAMKRQYAKA